MKYLKYFEQASAYEAYKNGSDFVLPNVSYVEDIKVVYYNPAEEKETRVVCTYNVTDTTSATKVCYYASSFTLMEVDGVLQDSVTTEYTFDTVGEHTIKFELTNQNSIGDDAFRSCSSLTSIVIPDSVTIIGMCAFTNCSSLTSVHIGSGVTIISSAAFANCSGLTDVHIASRVTSIGSNTFANCTNLNEITCLATTAPSIIPGTFSDINSGGILKVPAGSDYSSWMSTDYLGKYNWTVEYV